MPRIKTLAIPVIVLLLFVPGCSMDPTVSSPEEIIIAQAYTVQRAVEAYALDHDGEYPRWVRPYQDELLNPYTGLRTNPVEYPALAPGDVGYRRIEVDGDYRAYVINGAGKSSDIIVLYGNYPHSDSIAVLETVVRANCRLVVQAAEAFAAENNGEYAFGVYGAHGDTTLTGRALVDFLPGGELLVNPFTNARTEPTNVTATYKGQVGYIPTVNGGLFIGCVISGAGWRGDLVALGCFGPPEVCFD